MKGILIFVFGFLSGAAATGMYFKKKYRKMAEEEIESVKRAFSQSDEDSSDTQEGEKSSKDESESVSSLDFEYQKKEVTDYTAYSGESYMGKSEESLHPKDDTPIEESKEPYEITIDTYISSTGYKQYDFTYYSGDDTFINESFDSDTDDNIPEIIDDEHVYLGDALDESGFIYNTAPIIYVRNPDLHADFQITKKSGRYNDD